MDYSEWSMFLIKEKMKRVKRLGMIKNFKIGATAAGIFLSFAAQSVFLSGLAVAFFGLFLSNVYPTVVSIAEEKLDIGCERCAQQLYYISNKIHLFQHTGSVVWLQEQRSVKCCTQSL